MSLRPQDVLLALDVATVPERSDWTYAQIASHLRLSTGEAYNSAQRAMRAGFVFERGGKAVADATKLYNFLVGALPIVFFAQRGVVARGMPTSTSAPPLTRFAKEGDIPLVWEHEDGTSRGETIKPLYHTVPEVAAGDGDFYESMVLLDCLRTSSGKARDAAASMMASRLKIK